MTDLLRVFLQTNQDIRKFFWFEVGSDSSIYCGSSCSKVFKYGYKGTKETTPNGVKVGVYEGSCQTTEELIRKYSFHQSGVINLPTMQEGKNDRLLTRSLNERDYPMPLFGIVPMLPTKYPINQKEIKENSIVINCGLNSGKSFGIIFFISIDRSEPVLITRLKSDGFNVALKSVDLNRYQLGVILYFNDQFLGWPKEQIKIISHPNSKNQLNWPIVIPDQRT